MTINRRKNIDWRHALAEHDRWLRTVAYARLRNRDSVNEAMQNVALAVLKADRQSVEPDRVAPWLYRIVVRQCLLIRRQWGRRLRLQRQYQSQVNEDAGTDPQDALDWILASERQELVRKALSMLAVRDSEILLLKYCQQWTYQQIAERLGVSVGAIEGRLHRARRRLRSELITLNFREAAT